MGSRIPVRQQAEILGPASGPKITMIHYKSKTRYRRRQGHRQKYTQVKITGIGGGKPAAAKGSAAKTRAAKSSASAKNTA